MIKAIIFDCDGLIIDTEKADYLSWKETYEAYGVVLPMDKWLESIGTVNHFDPFNTLLELTGLPLEAEPVQTRRSQRNLELVSHLPALPGVLAYVHEAKQLGLKTAVASSSLHNWVDPILAQLELTGQFDWVSCRDDVGYVGKPNPAVYLAALAALGVRPDETLALEDSPHGMAAAQAAGIFCVVVPNQLTSQLPFNQPDYWLSSLADMPLKQLLNHAN